MSIAAAAERNKHTNFTNVVQSKLIEVGVKRLLLLYFPTIAVVLTVF